MWRSIRTLLLVAGLAGGSRGQDGIRFEFSYEAGISSSLRTQISGAVERAAAAWVPHLHDEVTIRIGIDYVVDPASSSKARGTTRYSGLPWTTFRDALVADAAGINDLVAIEHLPEEAIPVYINYTADNPNGSGSPVAYLDDNGDDNNTLIRVPHAIAKAVGLRDPSDEAEDGSIQVNGRHAWDFDTTDGRIAEGDFDFQTTMTHEIGHILGFTSRLDPRLNTCSRRGNHSSTYSYLTPFDLFSFSEDSAEVGAIDWSADNRAKYFSIDGGATSLAGLSTGRPGSLLGCSGGGGGHTRGHWINVATAAGALGIMDPATTTDLVPEIVFQGITGLDLMAMDVIGWDTLPRFTGVTAFEALDGAAHLEWRAVNGASSYAILEAPGIGLLPLPVLEDLAGSMATLENLSDVPAGALVVEARGTMQARPETIQRPKFRPAGVVDSEPCSCHLHGIDP